MEKLIHNWWHKFKTCKFKLYRFSKTSIDRFKYQHVIIYESLLLASGFINWQLTLKCKDFQIMVNGQFESQPPGILLKMQTTWMLTRLQNQISGRNSCLTNQLDDTMCTDVWELRLLCGFCFVSAVFFLPLLTLFLCIPENLWRRCRWFRVIGKLESWKKKAIDEAGRKRDTATATC